ncbi:MAG: YbhN family protein, partial [Anaerolineae bacterium]
RRVPLAAAWDALHGLRWWQVALFALANGAVVLALNGRWWVLLRAGNQLSVNHHPITDYRLRITSCGRLTLHRLAAFGVSYFTPGPQFGGEPVQVLLTVRDGVPRPAAVTAVALDKSIELLANFGFLLAGVVVTLQAGVFGGQLGRGAVWLAVALFLLPLGLLAAVWRGGRPFSRLWRLVPHQWPRVRPIGQAIAESEGQMTAVCHEAPSALAGAVLFSAVSWLALVSEYWLMFWFLSVELTAVQTLIIMTTARVAFLLPLPGGLGILEAGQVTAVSALGFDPALGMGAALLIRARDVALALVGFGWGAFLLGRGAGGQRRRGASVSPAPPLPTLFRGGFT